HVPTCSSSPSPPLSSPTRRSSDLPFLLHAGLVRPVIAVRQPVVIRRIERGTRLHLAAKAEFIDGSISAIRTTHQERHQRPKTFLDRKSTRLNSSHQIISYAVFCLK